MEEEVPLIWLGPIEKVVSICLAGERVRERERIGYLSYGVEQIRRDNSAITNISNLYF
jgi:hypothetical protein